MRLAALAAELGARLQFRTAAGTFTKQQRYTALLAKTCIARIGAAAFRTRVARIAATWASTLGIARITAVAAMSGTAVMTALIAAVVAAEFTAHQITQHPINQSHDLFLCNGFHDDKN